MLALDDDKWEIREFEGCPTVDDDDWEYVDTEAEKECEMQLTYSAVLKRGREG